MIELRESVVTMSEEIIIVNSEDEEEVFIDLCDSEEEEGPGKNVPGLESDMDDSCIIEEQFAIERSLDRNQKSVIVVGREEKENRYTGSRAASKPTPEEGGAVARQKQKNMQVKPHKVLSNTWINLEMLEKKHGSLLSGHREAKALVKKPIRIPVETEEPPAKKSKIMKIHTVELTKDTHTVTEIKRPPSDISEEPCPPLKKCFVALKRTDPKTVQRENSIESSRPPSVDVKRTDRNLWTNFSTIEKQCHIRTNSCNNLTEPEEHERLRPASPALSDSSIFTDEGSDFSSDDELPDLDIEMVLEAPKPNLSWKDPYSSTASPSTYIKKKKVPTATLR